MWLLFEKSQGTGTAPGDRLQTNGYFGKEATWLRKSPKRTPAKRLGIHVVTGVAACWLNLNPHS